MTYVLLLWVSFVYISKYVNSTALILIPKKATGRSIGLLALGIFRPRSFPKYDMFAWRVFFLTWLTTLQSGFVKGRNIATHIVLEHEIVREHILSSNLKAQINDTQMNEYKVGRNDLNISHIFTWMTFWYLSTAPIDLFWL